MKRISTLLGIVIILATAIILFGGAFGYRYFTTQTKIQNPATSPVKINPDFSFEMKNGNPGINLAIKDRATGNIIQNIEIPYIDISFYKTLTITDVANNDNDINFDGYRDLEVLVYIPASNPGVSDFYKYNPSTKKFEKDPLLQNLIGSSFNSIAKTITSNASGGCAGKYREIKTYAFTSGNYVLDSIQDYSCCNMVSEGSYGITTTTYLKNGQTQTTKLACPIQN